MNTIQLTLDHAQTPNVASKLARDAFIHVTLQSPYGTGTVAHFGGQFSFFYNSESRDEITAKAETRLALSRAIATLLQGAVEEASGLYDDAKPIGE